jgi:hypothetical protein
MFKHLTLSIGFNHALDTDQLKKFLDDVQNAAEDYKPLAYFVAEELAPEHKDVLTA